MPRAILFDLDGTLVDTRAASWELFSETNREFALGIDTREAFFRAFEGNFFESLARLCPDAQRAAAAKAHFMELLRTRYNPGLIPGMIDVIHALAPHCTLAVISTNGIEAIRRILVGAGIATCFSHVFSGDVEPRKSASIRRFLGDHGYAAQRMCLPAYHDGQQSSVALDADEVVLVTDTVGDVAEAGEAGIRSIGVAWGMHTEQQLLEAGAERVALWPQELVAWLRGSDAAAACACSTVPSPTATSGQVIEAGRLRRERQLKLRQTNSITPIGTSLTPVSSRQSALNAPSSELLQAIRRIAGGPQMKSVAPVELFLSHTRHRVRNRSP